MLKCWFGFLLISGYICTTAQSTQDPQSERSLVEILNSLEKNYPIKFSYADQTVEGVYLPTDFSSGSLITEIVHDLQYLSGLMFEFINGENIIVREYKEDDIITICGRILDEFDNPLVGVAIITNEATIGDISDKRGEFEIDSITYGEKLLIQHLGYDVLIAPASNFSRLPCQSINLMESVKVLNELIVRDYLTEGITKDRKDIVISIPDLNILPGLIEPDILKSIQQSPGVNSPYETASGLHIRGGTPDQNLVLWNGIKTYNQGHFFGMLSSFNPYITKSVCFIKNGTSAKYGERVSGTIDIRSDEDVPERIEGGAGINMIYGDVYLHTPIIADHLSFNISGRRSYTDIMETFTYQQMSDRVFQNTKINDEISSDNQQTKNSFFFNDFTTGIIFTPTMNNKIQINTIYNKNDLDFESFDNLNSNSFNDRLKTESEGYSLKWKNQSIEKMTIELDGYFSRYLLKYEFINTISDTTESSTKKNLIQDLGINFNTAYKFNSDHTLFTGYQYSNSNIKYAFETFAPSYRIVLDDDDSRVATHSAYIEYIFSKGDRMKISSGIRSNHYRELKKIFFEPRISATQKISSSIWLNLSAEYKTQVASQIKESVISDLSLENQVWTLSSRERFPVIKGYQFTFGGDFLKNSWMIGIEGYLKNISGVTSLTFGFLNPIDNEFRKGESDIVGTDLFIKKQFTNYRTWFGYSYIRTNNTFQGLNNNRSFPGNWNIEHTLKWSHFYTLGKFEFALGWRFHSGKAFTDVTQDTSFAGPVVIQYGRLNGETLPVYHRLDISAIYEFTQKKDVKYRIGLSVLNVYDRKNLLNREFRTTPSLDNDLIDTRIYSLGITPNLTFRVSW